LFGGYLKVGSHVAVPCPPFGWRIREYGAILSGGKFLDLLAALTLLDNCVAGAAIKPTAFLAHKEAIKPRLYACANHFNHILSVIKCLGIATTQVKL
jgi:hypothetical protein